MAFAASIQCPNCGATVAAPMQTCPACGFPLAETLAQATRNPEAARQLAEELNQDLIKSATSASELAFSVSCTLAAILIGLLLIVVYFAISRAPTVVFVAAFLAVLLGVVVAALLATRAKNATLEQTFRRQAEPRIASYLHSSGYSREEFGELAAAELPHDAPLLTYMQMNPLQEQSEI